MNSNDRSKLEAQKLNLERKIAIAEGYLYGIINRIKKEEV